jgi:hypothetical protein
MTENKILKNLEKLKEKLGDVVVAPCVHDFGNGNELAYFYNCFRITENGLDEFYKNVYFHTYEEAEQAGVLFCLQTIIKDKKK